MKIKMCFAFGLDFDKYRIQTATGIKPECLKLTKHIHVFIPLLKKRNSLNNYKQTVYKSKYKARQTVRAQEITKQP